MLKAQFEDGTFLIGLDRGNINRLKKGQPILVSLAELGGTDDFYIIYGDTIDDMKRELEEAQGRHNERS